MIGGRRGKNRIASECFIVHQRFIVTIRQQLARQRLKSHSPIKRLNVVTTPRISVQVVHKIATANYQNAFFPQRRQPLSQRVMKFRRLSFVDAKLHHRNVRFRKNVTQH